MKSSPYTVPLDTDARHHQASVSQPPSFSLKFPCPGSTLQIKPLTKINSLNWRSYSTDPRGSQMTRLMRSFITPIDNILIFGLILKNLGPQALSKKSLPSDWQKPNLSSSKFSKEHGCCWLIQGRPWALWTDQEPAHKLNTHFSTSIYKNFYS